jgi:hypothetical protein
MKAFRVLLNGREIDKVFYDDKDTITADEVRLSLINHDGYDARIVVIKERDRR